MLASVYMAAHTLLYRYYWCYSTDYRSCYCYWYYQVPVLVLLVS
jgi:hypothetical protein